MLRISMFPLKLIPCHVQYYNPMTPFSLQSLTNLTPCKCGSRGAARAAKSLRWSV